MAGRAPRWIILVVGFIGCLWIVPIIGIVATSLQTTDSIARGWWHFGENQFSLQAWYTVWQTYPLAGSLWVSAKITLTATILTMITAPAAAYTFHYLRFPMRRLWLIIIINAFVLPQQVVIIPLFQLWRDVGLLDNMAAVVIPFVGLSYAWAVFLVKSFLEDFPKELIEAAKIDGCGPIRTFTQVVLPNLISPIAACGILQFLWCWNTLLLPMLFLRSDISLTVLLARIAGTYDPNLDQQAVAAIVTAVIPLSIFLLFQKQFAAGNRVSSGGKE
ncbi:carbohydrate ABC transporter permease [Affinirhizobium pseudoryzae]|uniref:carbohydrate ABC transporter permease n=1 Tax=Allorhizobium pseudoryzae TaxID=379684 RepID=UPI0013EB99BB|nr:carbohydrate ABC transporter permease [Allorhizobium pseudoryzae]